ncbi:MAG: hypothetical protein E6R03_17405, partial [Hyphomicrobiaceae bacterium]
MFLPAFGGNRVERTWGRLGGVGRPKREIEVLGEHLLNPRFGVALTIFEALAASPGEEREMFARKEGTIGKFKTLSVEEIGKGDDENGM